MNSINAQVKQPYRLKTSNCNISLEIEGKNCTNLLRLFKVGKVICIYICFIFLTISTLLFSAVTYRLSGRTDDLFSYIDKGEAPPIWVLCIILTSLAISSFVVSEVYMRLSKNYKLRHMVYLIEYSGYTMSHIDLVKGRMLITCENGKRPTFKVAYNKRNIPEVATGTHVIIYFHETNGRIVCDVS